jgi:DNA-binding SARP family transcriptional activator/ABC-type transport system substrate-binding protein
MEPMRFGVLGPLLAEIDGHLLALPGRKQQALLALLLLNANRPVSRASLVDGLWGERPPASADHAFETHVSRLRKTLGGASRLRTETSGYRLEVGADELDLDTFRRLLEDGRAAAVHGEPEEAARVLRRALALWRGAPLAGIEEPFAELERGRLEELRLTALEERIDADLARGEAAALVAELRALVADEPFRERPRRQLMLALYRSGRQADALEAYQQARRQFVDELGIEPAADLRELEQAVLRQDPALVAPRRATARSTDRRLPRSRSPLVVALGAAVLVAVAAVVVAVVSGRGSGSRIGPVDANAAVRVGTNGKDLVKQVAVGAGPARAVAGGGAVWTSNTVDGTVSRIDTRTGNVQTIAVGNSPAGLAFGAGQLWVADAEGGILSQVDPRTGKIVRTVGVGNGPSGVAFGFGAVWVTNSVDGTLVRVDPVAGVVRKEISVGVGPGAVAAGAGSVWVALPEAGSVVRVEPDSGDVVDIVTVGNDPVTLAAGAKGVWVANAQDGTVTRIAPESDAKLWSTPVGAAPSGLAVDGDNVWVAVAGSGELVRLDGDGHVLRTIEVGNAPAAAAVTPDGVWVTTLAAADTHRGGTLRVEASELSECRCIDPAVAWEAAEWQLLNLVYDGLVAYRRVGGSGGAALVGDLARTVPRPTPDGRNYVFRLRAGVRYSDGTGVRATDVRRSMERLYAVNGSSTPSFYGSIVGAAACARAAARCDLSRGIVADDAAGTVAFHLTTPDPEFLYKLALPFASVVPAAAPAAVARSRPLAGTGPYRIDRFVPVRELRLVRNSRFRVFAPAARPDGFPDRIVARLSVGIVDQIRAVVSGRADVAGGASALTFWPFSVDAANLGQVRVAPFGSTEFFFLNTHVPPFDDLRVRRAVNLAVDRSRLAALARGPQAARPTCQILPPGFPGYRPYCPYTLNPSAAGTWTAPDIGRALRLVAGSATKGMRVTVWSDASRRRVAGYFASVLRELGFRADVRVREQRAYYDTISNSRRRAQAGPNAWIRDYTSAANFIKPLFSCSSFVPGDAALTSNVSQFCDRALDRRMARASKLQATDPARAGDEWARVDRAIVDAAAAVPYANGLDVTLLSKRVGNYQFNPMWGVLLDQLWVR